MWQEKLTKSSAPKAVKKPKLAKRAKPSEQPNNDQRANAPEQPSDVERTFSSGLDDPKKECKIYDDKMGNNPKRWHSELCQVTGRLVYRIGKGSAPREEVEGWIIRLNDVAEQMRRFVDARRRGK